MSITNKYQNSGSELGLSLNKGYFYDVTPQVKNITNMNLLYSNRLFDDKLAIDVNPNDREILYISDTTIPQSMMANFVGKDGFDNNLFYRYHFKKPGKQVFQNIMSCGWTFETVMNFDNKDMTDFSVFYYLGVGFEKELIDGELVDTSRSYEKDYLHNNIAFGFDKNKSIVVRSARYTEECYGCDEEEKNYSSTECGGDSSVTVTSGNLVTGSTLYEHSFDKAICSDDNTNFLVTVKVERDSSIINNMCTELGTKFVESESERIGTLKVYVNGLLYGSIYGFEDIVTRRASLPVHEFVQGWGFSDNFFISEDYNMFGTFEGKQPRGRFHSNPLSLSEIRHNYKQLKDCYDIIGCFDLNCGPTFPEKVIEECPNSKTDETTPISTTTTTEEITTTTSTMEEVTTTTTNVDPTDTTEPPICNPFEVNGYYPLYLTQDCAERHVGGNGQFHTHDFGDPMVTYYMPNGLNMDPNNGLVTMWHGNYTT